MYRVFSFPLETFHIVSTSSILKCIIYDVIFFQTFYWTLGGLFLSENSRLWGIWGKFSCIIPLIIFPIKFFCILFLKFLLLKFQVFLPWNIFLGYNLFLNNFNLPLFLYFISRISINSTWFSNVLIFYLSYFPCLWLFVLLTVLFLQFYLQSFK